MHDMPVWEAWGHIFNYELRFKADDDPTNFGPKLTKQLRNIQRGTKKYADNIKELWENFKLDPTQTNAELFAEALADLTEKDFEEWFPAFLLVEEMSAQQKDYLRRQVDTQKGYIVNSLLPDMIKGIAGAASMSGFDHRILIMYPGFLWHSGMLGTVVFDGLELRDLADLFLFAGPKDDRTCKGERGCETYANRIFTVAEILARDIIPGHMNCITNCRHFLLPIASPLNKRQKTELNDSLQGQYGLKNTLEYLR